SGKITLKPYLYAITLKRNGMNEMQFTQKSIVAVLLFLMFSVYSVRAQGILERLKQAIEQKKSVSDSTASKSASLQGISSNEMSSALKQALNLGVSEGIEKLGAEDGFFKNELVKIMLPEQLRKVDGTLRSIGLSSLADR